MKSSRGWGAAVVVMAWAGLAAAQVPAGSASAAGAAGASGGAAPVPTPAPTTGSAPITLEDETTAPTPPAPDPAPTAPVAEEKAEEEEAVEAPRQRKRKKAPRRQFFNQYDQQEGQQEGPGEEREHDGPAEEAPVAVPPGFRLEGPLFVLGAERLTSILGWSATAKGERDNFDGSTDTIEATTSGLDVSLLGAGGFPRNPFSAPRVSFDYVFKSGFSLGGSVGYMVSSADLEQPDIEGSGTTKIKQPTTSTLLFAPRIGAFIPAAPQVAVWLRGGFTRVVAAVERGGSIDGVSTTTLTTTASMWDLSLDPQLVLSPIPHVAITLGVTLDIGVSGEVESEVSGKTVTTEGTQSSYGVSSGLVALF